MVIKPLLCFFVLFFLGSLPVLSTEVEDVEKDHVDVSPMDV